jgi:CubicO group peptidase (beta-lactamase class C family)
VRKLRILLTKQLVLSNRAERVATRNPPEHADVLPMLPSRAVNTRWPLYAFDFRRSSSAPRRTVPTREDLAMLHRSSAPRPIRFAALATTFIVVCAVVSTPAGAQLSRVEQVRLMDSIANSPVVEKRVAGIAVAVVKGTDTLLHKSYGQADLSWGTPMPTDAVFEIGSVTKQFTAAAVLQLRDEGKIDLDADITTYLPDYPTQGHRIPVRRLLDHTSGIRGYTEMEAFGEFAPRKLPRDSLVARFAAEPFDFPPGQALIYNNSAYFLLGLIIEKTSGMPYEEYVEKHLFAKLGMTRSSYCSNSEVVPRQARGYSLTDTGLIRAPYLDHTWPYAAGSLCSTTGDLITWLRALHGGKVLPAKSYQEMITPGTLEDGTPVRYAMGLARTPDPRGRASIHHGGGIFGFLSDTRYYPDEDLYVVVLVNTTGNLSPAAIANEMVDVILPPKPVERRTFAGDATPLVGTYSGPARGRPMTVKVAAGENGPTASVNDGRAAPMMWVDAWTFQIGGQLITFERGADSGPATVMRIDSGGGHYVLRRSDTN